LVETSMVVEGHFRDRGIRELDAFIRSAGIRVEPITEEQAYVARQAWSDFGKGRHPARLNLGDCFSYALARSLAEPLLFKGTDFEKTDIAPAL
jgi:ribonuclease VapC